MLESILYKGQEKKWLVCLRFRLFTFILWHKSMIKYSLKRSRLTLVKNEYCGISYGPMRHWYEMIDLLILLHFIFIVSNLLYFVHPNIWWLFIPSNINCGIKWTFQFFCERTFVFHQNENNFFTNSFVKSILKCNNIRQKIFIFFFLILHLSYLFYLKDSIFWYHLLFQSVNVFVRVYVGQEGEKDITNW